MRAVVTRVKSASVAVDGKTMGAIGQGLLILLGIAPEDTPAHCKKLADKILGLRIFRDDDDKMNRSLADVGGSVLVVSQFTLYGDCRKGRRPSFTGAAAPETRAHGFPPQHGQFGADMLVTSENNGPVTLILDTDELM